MAVTDEHLHHLIHLRREIHRHPEISGKEQKTSERIRDFLSAYNPDQVITGVGGNGLIVLFNGALPGPTVVFRAELDALPIAEINDLPYRSEDVDTGHLCGHDAHMVMVAGIALKLQQNRPRKGRVALLFQPAEETGEGAARMLADEQFKELRPDYIFALHNLPGFPKGQIVLKEGTFASASKGVIITLDGKTSHAAEPENGISPSQAVSQLIGLIENTTNEITELEGFALATLVHVRIGDRAFGVTPGHAVVMITIRAYLDDDLIRLEEYLINKARETAKTHGLEVSFSHAESFHSTINDQECCEYIRQAADDLNLSFTQVKQPFRWSEDFGLFTQKFQGAMFGLGAGEDTPDLHNPNYDFPEEVISSGLAMFEQIVKNILN